MNIQEAPESLWLQLSSAGSLSKYKRAKKITHFHIQMQLSQAVPEGTSKVVYALATLCFAQLIILLGNAI